MRRGDGRAIPIPSSAASMATAADMVDATYMLDTPAFARHQGVRPAGGPPVAYSPFRHAQQARQLTAQAVDDPFDVGGSGSLAARAAFEHTRRKKLSDAVSSAASIRTAIVDFVSTQSNAALHDSQRCATPRPGVVGSMPLRLSDPITNILGHTLLYAQISSYELRDLRRRQTVAPPCADTPIIDLPVNAAPRACREEQYALTISEKYTIDDCNRIVELLPNTAAVALPRTLTRVRSLVRLSPLAAGACGCDPVYVVRTECAHDYVPCMVFYLLVGGTLLRTPLQAECDSGDPACDPLKPGAATICFLVLDVVDDHALLVRQIGTVCDTPPNFRPLTSRRTGAIRGQRPSHVFVACGEPCYAVKSEKQQVCDDIEQNVQTWLSWDEHTVMAEAERAFGEGDGTFPYITLYQVASCSGVAPSDPCCDSKPPRCEPPSPCGATFAYVPPPTSPEQLASLIDGVVASIRAASCHTSTALHGVTGVDYDAQIDMYSVKLSNGGFVRYRTLLTPDTSSLNFPLRRLRMVATEQCFTSKQQYLQRVLDGTHWFVVNADNDTFRVALNTPAAAGSTCQTTTCANIVVPSGCYTGTDLAALLQQLLTMTFGVPFTVQFRVYNVESTPPNREPLGENYNAPYAVQAFVFTIALSDCAPPTSTFTLYLAATPHFAALIDYEARCYRRVRCTKGRFLAALPGCDPCPPPGVTLPCPRRRYRAFVDQSCGQTTLQQCAVAPTPCTWPTEPAPHGCIVLACEACASDECDPDDECDTNACCFPYCQGDVLWLPATNPVCATCGDDKKGVPLMGAIVVAIDPVIDTNASPDELHCSYLVRTHLSAKGTPAPPPNSVVCALASPVGFNVHLHPALPPVASNNLKPSVSSSERVAAEWSAVARWLGFDNPATRSGETSYTSASGGTVLLDEYILLRIPELCTIGLSEHRATYYNQLSPFDDVLEEVYAVLVLDRGSLAYRYSSTRFANDGFLRAVQFLTRPSSGQTCTPTLSFQLLRPDGSPYETGGSPLVASVGIYYC